MLWFKLSSIITHVERSRGGRVFTDVCLHVCLSVYPHNFSKTDAVRITKRDLEMFHDVYWKPLILESKVKATSHRKKTLLAWIFALFVSAGFF